jgi:hypothetical protein
MTKATLSGEQPFQIFYFRARVESNFSAYFLVKHFCSKVGQCRPGDQCSRDKGEDAEYAHDGNRVTGFYGIDDVGCVFHGVAPLLLSFGEKVAVKVSIPDKKFWPS